MEKTKLIAMKTYVFATDFSDNALKALEFAVPFVKQLKGQLMLFHAVDYLDMYLEIPAPVLEKINEEKREDATRQLIAWQQIVHDMDAELPCSYRVHKGSLLAALQLLLKEENVEMLMMGTRGATGLKRILIGSNTASVIGRVSCPVLAIPEDSRFEGINNILYATDFHEDHGFILEEINRIATAFKAKIDLLHVATESEKVDPEIYNWYQDAVMEILPKKHITFHVKKAERVHKGISKYVDETQPDLVVMSMHKKNWLERLLTGSYTRRQVSHTQKPLLIFHCDAYSRTSSAGQVEQSQQLAAS
ncbi:MAG: universal stress protein [Bacteroidetes bacterium]|nr:MAG: universal stress protein [Bacteroidota bacterium]